MAKVEMSLKEYDEIKQELDFLRRVIKEITTPRLSEDDLKSYKDSEYGYDANTEITPEVKRYLLNQAKQNISEKIKDNSDWEIIQEFCNPDQYYCNIKLATIRYLTPQQKLEKYWYDMEPKRKDKIRDTYKNSTPELRKELAKNIASDLNIEDVDICLEFLHILHDRLPSLDD